MLFSIVLPGGKVNPIIKMVNRWSLALRDQPLSPTAGPIQNMNHVFFDIKSSFLILLIISEFHNL